MCVLTVILIAYVYIITHFLFTIMLRYVYTIHATHYQWFTAYPPFHQTANPNPVGLPYLLLSLPMFIDNKSFVWQNPSNYSGKQMKLKSAANPLNPIGFKPSPNSQQKAPLSFFIERKRRYVPALVCSGACDKCQYLRRPLDSVCHAVMSRDHIGDCVQSNEVLAYIYTIGIHKIYTQAYAYIHIGVHICLYKLYMFTIIYVNLSPCSSI